MIQLRILISARVTPLDSLLNALRDRTCPKNATNTVTKDSSINFPKSCVRTLAVAAVSEPLVWIVLPHRGARIAMARYIPEKMVENTARTMIEIASQFDRP
jgi:hypothetical protein